MMLSVFHRTSDAVYAPPCDVASVPVFDIATGEPAGFVGASWIQPEDPPAEDVLHVAVVEMGTLLDTVLEGWGLRLAPTQPYPQAGE